MEPQQWPQRRRQLVAAQLARGALDAPWPQASWVSVLRRSAVVAGFLAFALVTNRLDSAVFAAFGALQVGLTEGALPLRGLVRQSALTVIAITVVSTAAMALSGSWWTVVLLAGVAFLHGASSTMGPVSRSVGIGALAMGVICAGISADPATAIPWLVIGAATQVASSVVFWRRERTLSIRIFLANTIRSAERIALSAHVSGHASNAASGQIDEALELIRTSEVPNGQAASWVARCVNEVRRNLVAWRELEQPGLVARLRIAQRLRVQVSLLTEGRRREDAALRGSPPEAWPIARQLEASIDVLGDAVAGADRPDPAVARATDVGADGGTGRDSVAVRHGLRMACAIAVGQTLALLLPIQHAFWIPLTCVFVVKPDWAFTVLRSLARIGGNLLAVLVVPAVAYVLGAHDLAIAGAVFAISVVAFHYFTGNYILGSFGIAGTILILDNLVSHNPDLYAARIVATLVGAAVGILSVALLPSWRSGQALALVDVTVAGLCAWSRRVVKAVQDPSEVAEAELLEVSEPQRKNLIRLRPAVYAAVLEPRPAADPRSLAAIVDAIARAHLCLLALREEARCRRMGGQPGLDITTPAAVADAALCEAMGTLGLPAPRAADGSAPDVVPAASDQDQAVVVEAIRLQQAARDLAEAVRWLKGT